MLIKAKAEVFVGEVWLVSRWLAAFRVVQILVLMSRLSSLQESVQSYVGPDFAFGAGDTAPSETQYTALCLNSARSLFASIQ